MNNKILYPDTKFSTSTMDCMVHVELSNPRVRATCAPCMEKIYEKNTETRALAPYPFDAIIWFCPKKLD